MSACGEKHILSFETFKWRAKSNPTASVQNEKSTERQPHSSNHRVLLTLGEVGIERQADHFP